MRQAPKFYSLQVFAAHADYVAHVICANAILTLTVHYRFLLRTEKRKAGIIQDKLASSCFPHIQLVKYYLLLKTHHTSKI